MNLHAQVDASAPAKVARRRAVAEVCLATLAIGLLIVLSELLARIVPVTAGYVSALVAFAFLAVPVGVARWRKIGGDVHGLSGDWRKAALWGVAATVLVAGPFVFGFDVLQTQYLHNTRFGGPGLTDFEARFIGAPRRLSKGVIVHADGPTLVVHNGLGAAFTVDPACAQVCKERPAVPMCKRRLLMPAARLTLRTPAHNCFEIFAKSPTGSGWVHAADSAVLTGELRQPVEGQPMHAPRSMWWLLWSLLTQLVVVALPEEVFFRGYVQHRLRAVWPPRRKLLGTPFGQAHIAAAALFALIHLAANPAASRLLVFFPALLFAWLAERTQSVVAPTVHHALSNLMLQVARRFYS